MKKRWLNTRQSNKGFTIVELAVVIVVLSIITAIAVFGYGTFRERSDDAAIQSDLQYVAANLERYYAKYGVYPAGMSQLSDPVMRFILAKDSYGPNAMVAGANLLYCRKTTTSRTSTVVPDDPPHKFALVAQSKSGVIFSYRSDQQEVREVPMWRREGSHHQCQDLGINQTSGSDRDFFYFNHNWQPYVK